MLGLRTSGHASAHRPQGQALQALWDPWSPAACRLGGGASSSTCSPGLAPPPGSPPGEKGSPRSGVPLPPEHPALGLRSAVPVPRPRPARGRWLRVGPAQAWSLRPRGARQAFSKGLPRSLKATRPEAAGPCHRGLGDWVFGGSPAAEAWRGRGTETGLRGRGTESRFPRGAATAAAARPSSPPRGTLPARRASPRSRRGTWEEGFPCPPTEGGAASGDSPPSDAHPPQTQAPAPRPRARILDSKGAQGPPRSAGGRSLGPAGPEEANQTHPPAPARLAARPEGAGIGKSWNQHCDPLEVPCPALRPETGGRGLAPGRGLAGPSALSAPARC